jgi:hypothetical protein
VLLMGCHSSTFIPGTVVVSMGNPNPDPQFASYVVAVDSITLTQNTGAVVALLSTPETIDLAQLNNRTELVEAPAVPVGTYTSATFIIDYTAASLWVNVDGKVQSASVTGIDNAVLTTESITVPFDPQHPLVVAQNVSKRVAMEVDLTASNSIDTSTSPVSVTAQPFVLVTPAPQDTTVMRARGLFVTTQTLPSGFYMNMRPFYDLVSALGAVIVNTNAQTYFNINGVTYVGAAGLIELATQEESTAVVAYGTLDNLSSITPTFNATSVYVGSSQESEVAYYATGVVTSRSGNNLLLTGATLLSPLGTTLYNGTLYPITVDSTTDVSQDGVVARDLSTASISVGQQINVSGQAIYNTADTEIVGLDASGAQVRLQPTQLWGTLNSATADSASLAMLTLNNLVPNTFHFEGASRPGYNVNAPAYIVDTGTLDQSAVAPGTLLEVNGFVTPYRSAPPNFTASTITPGSATVQQLVVEWVNGGAVSPFSQVTADGLIVDLANRDLGPVHWIRTGPSYVELTSLPASPLITTVGADQSNLQLAVGSASLTSGISVYNTPATFAEGIKNLLNGTNKAYRLVAYGQYDSSTNTFVASRIHVALEETTTTS